MGRGRLADTGGPADRRWHDVVRCPPRISAADGNGAAVSGFLDGPWSHRRAAIAGFRRDRLSAHIRFSEAIDLQSDWRFPSEAGVPVALSCAILLYSGLHRR